MLRWTIIIASLSAALALAAGALAATSLTQFVVLPGEETGFLPEKPQSVTTLKAYVRGATRKEAQRETKRLSSEGFVAAIREHTRDAKLHAEGLSTALALGSPAAAAKELASELKSDIAAQGKSAIIHWFVIAGVPGAVGFTATEHHHPGGASNVVWREGSCVLLVGDFLPHGSSAALTAPVTAGTLAVEGRTAGACP
jgi:hypothetical protein